MSSEDPITLWIENLKNQQPEAAAGIWHHFAQRLLSIARKQISPMSRGRYDEEDAAQSAFNSLWAGMAQGRFEDVRDRDSLWRVLLVITSRKISARRRYEGRKRREAARSVTESVFCEERGLDGLPSSEPSPEFAAGFEETCAEMFSGLDSEKLRKVGLLKMEGYSDLEVAEQLSCSRRTVQRRLELIRRNWMSAADQACAE